MTVEIPEPAGACSPDPQSRRGLEVGVAWALPNLRHGDAKPLGSIPGASEKSPALLPERTRHAALPGQRLTLPLLNAILSFLVLFYLRSLWNEGVRGGAERLFCALWLALRKGMELLWLTLGAEDSYLLWPALVGKEE